MKTIKANRDDKRPLSSAEQEAWDVLRDSDRSGQAIFHPLVDPGPAEPSCVVFLAGVARFAIRLMPGQYSLVNGQWLCHDEAGGAGAVDDPLEEAWQAAAAVRTKLKRELGIGAYVIPVAMFPDMGEDEDILAATQGTKVRVLCGRGDLVRRLAGLPTEGQRQLQLSKRFIEREVATLNRPSRRREPVAADPVPEATPEDVLAELAGRIGALVLQRVETVHIHVTIVYGSANGAEPPLLTVQGT